MKILILNDAASAVGGAETLTLDLRAEFRRRGHDARVFASNALADGVANPADYVCRGATGPLRTLNRVANPDAWIRLRRVLDGFRPDVVHVRMFMTQLSPLILPLLRAVPCLYHAAWYETICPTGLRLLPSGAVCEHTAGRACRAQGCLSRKAWVALMVQRQLWLHWRDVFSLVVTNSAATERRLAQYGVGPTRVIWNGVRHRDARPSLGGHPVVAYAGRLSHEKGVHVLIRAFARVVESLPDAVLLLVGNGPDRRSLERLAEQIGVFASIRWMGHLERDAMERALDPVWVQAVPSVVEEPFGLAAAEAMMRGTAVVASGHGGLTEIVRPGETGLQVPANDPAALAQSLCTLLCDRERCESLGKAARAWAWDRLSLERCADSFLDAYRDVIAARAA